MFPWDRKTQALQGRKNGYRANSTIDRRDLSYVAGNPHSIPPQSDHLPTLNSRHRGSVERDPSYIRQNSMEYQETQDSPPADYNQNNGRSSYSRSQSYSPFEGRNERIASQQKNYAKILQEQINSKNAKKDFEKQKNLDLDKRMLEGGDFYKYFGRNHLEEKYRNQSLLPSIEATTRNRYTDVRGSTPIEGRYTPNKVDNSYMDFAPTHHSAMKYQDEGPDPLNEKTKDYLKKIEYKQALEQQILELNLRKKHEAEVRALEDKLDEVKHSYVRLKTKPGKEVSYEKLQGVPVMINGSEVLLKPLDPYKPSSLTGRGANTRKYMPTHDLRLKPIIKGRQSLDVSNDINTSAFNPQTMLVDEGLVSNYFQVQGELDRIKTDIRDHMTKMNDKLVDLRSELASHSRGTQDRDMLMQALKDNNPRLTTGTPYEATDGYLPLPVIDGQGDESGNSLTHIETQFVPVNEVAGTNKNYPQYSIMATPDYNPLMDNLASLTKKIDHSIQNQQQKFDRDLAVIQHELRLFKKNEEEIQMEKLNEYVNLIGNFVGSTRKLEKTLSAQQQKLNREIGTIQEELRSFKANEQAYQMRTLNEYSPLVEDMVTLTKKLERSLNTQQHRLATELGSIQQELRTLKTRDDHKWFAPLMREEPKVFVTNDYEPKVFEPKVFLPTYSNVDRSDRGGDRYSLHDNLANVGARYGQNGYLNGGGDLTKTKVRTRSQNVQHNKRGVKRIRDELPAESQQRIA